MVSFDRLIHYLSQPILKETPERERKKSHGGRERTHFLLASASATLASASQVQAPCLRASRDLPLWPVFRHLPRTLIPLTIGTARLAGPG